MSVAQPTIPERCAHPGDDAGWVVYVSPDNLDDDPARLTQPCSAVRVTCPSLHRRMHLPVVLHENPLPAKDEVTASDEAAAVVDDDSVDLAGREARSAQEHAKMRLTGRLGAGVQPCDGAARSTASGVPQPPLGDDAESLRCHAVGPQDDITQGHEMGSGQQ